MHKFFLIFASALFALCGEQMNLKSFQATQTRQDSTAVKNESKLNLGADRDFVAKEFINYLRGFMEMWSGTLSRTGSGSPKIKIKEADYDWWPPDWFN